MISQMEIGMGPLQKSIQEHQWLLRNGDAILESAQLYKQ